MSEMVKVAVDAMGGDNAPSEIVKGAVEAANESSSVKVYLVGAENVIKDELKKYSYQPQRPCGGNHRDRRASGYGNP